MEKKDIFQEIAQKEVMLELVAEEDLEVVEEDLEVVEVVEEEAEEEEVPMSVSLLKIKLELKVVFLDLKAQKKNCEFDLINQNFMS